MKHFTSISANRRSTETLVSSEALFGMQFCECWLCINVSLVGWCVLFFCRPLFLTLMVPFGLVHSVKSCDAVYFLFFIYLFIFIFLSYFILFYFYFPISLLWRCHDFVARASVHQQSANGVLIRSWEFVLITVSHVFCAPFYN